MSGGCGEDAGIGRPMPVLPAGRAKCRVPGRWGIDMSGHTNGLSKPGGTAVAAWALSTAFLTYFCMYAFRKPFTAATFDHVTGWPFGIDFKSTLIICQVFGYALSKFIGIRVVSEASDKGRGVTILLLIVASELALVLFALVPVPFKPLAMFLNGLPLGMIWGLVFRYLEGRRTSEILGAGLCTSFILSSGVVKSAGRTLIDQFGISDFWMPALTGLAFLPLIALSVYLLSLTPPPNEADQAARAARQPMLQTDRKTFFRDNGPGLILLTLSFIALGSLRDFRDNFAADIWKAVGYGNTPSIFTYSEIPAAILVLVCVGSVIMVRNNQRAVWVIHLLMAVGILMSLGATIAFHLGLLDPVWWMVILGAGIYLGYVPCTSILADRLIASLKSGGNSGYMLYLLDAWAYGGSVAVLLYKAVASGHQSWLGFFLALTYPSLIIGLIATVGSMIYFDRRATRLASA